MKRTYCDICEQPMKYNGNTLVEILKPATGKPQVGFKIHFGTTAYRLANEEWGGDICHGCVFDAIAKLDDRPKLNGQDAWADLNHAVKSAMRDFVQRPSFSAEAMYSFMCGFFQSSPAPGRVARPADSKSYGWIFSLLQHRLTVTPGEAADIVEAIADLERRSKPMPEGVKGWIDRHGNFCPVNGAAPVAPRVDSDMFAALKGLHNAVDILWAERVAMDNTFRPTQHRTFEAMNDANTIIKRMEMVEGVKNRIRGTIDDLKQAESVPLTIEQFREVHGLQWRLHDCGPEGFGISFQECEVKDGAMLRGSWGSGRTVNDAKADYAKQIAGKMLVVGAYKPARREIQVPALFTPPHSSGLSQVNDVADELHPQEPPPAMREA